MEKEREKDFEFEDEISLPVTSYWKDVVRRFCKNRIAVLGLILLTIIVVLCAGAPLFTRYDPVIDMDLMNMLTPPGDREHPLGTDDLGRDIWCRLLYGGRSSLLTGLSVAAFAAVIGVTIGLYSGYFGGIVESLLMRFTDIMLSFPFLIVAIAIMSVLGSSQKNIIMTLAITSWPRFARLTRGQVLSVKNMEYVESARVAGFKDVRILFRHVLPNCIGPLIIQGTLAVGSAILSAAQPQLSGSWSRCGCSGLGNDAEPGEELSAAGSLSDNHSRYCHFHHRSFHELDWRRTQGCV